MKRCIWAMIVFICGGLLAGCLGITPAPTPSAATAAPPSATPSATARVVGVVTYRERSALPPDAVLTVTLADVSVADAPITRAQQTIAPAGQPPIAFELPYDPATLDPGGSYVVQATIRQGERVLFATSRAYPVLTGGDAAPIEIVVEPAPSP